LGKVDDLLILNSQMNRHRNFILVLLAGKIATFCTVTHSEELVLKKGDIVSINVFDETSLTGAFTVGPEGTIIFPLLGSIVAGGITPAELAKQIEASLESGYIRDAQVAVAIAEEAQLPPHTVTVIGQVMAPGQVAFKPGTPMDLFTAVSSAGGLAERGNRNSIELKRRSGDDIQSRTLTLEGDRVFEIKDGDTIIVNTLPVVKEEAEIIPTVTVVGQVKSPGQIPYNPKIPLDLIGAIAIAGGFTDLARPSKVIVRRVTADGVKAFEVNVSKMQQGQTAPFMLEPNDTVTVTESIF
jgi:polysaccharide biosynthesis/export protein